MIVLVLERVSPSRELSVHLIINTDNANTPKFSMTDSLRYNPTVFHQSANGSPAYFSGEVLYVRIVLLSKNSILSRKQDQPSKWLNAMLFFQENFYMWIPTHA